MIKKLLSILCFIFIVSCASINRQTNENRNYYIYSVIIILKDQQIAIANLRNLEVFSPKTLEEYHCKEWLLKVGNNIKKIKNSELNLTKLNPPNEFKLEHAKLVIATKHLSKFSDFIIDGIEESNYYKIELAVIEMEKAAEIINQINKGYL